MSVLLITHDLGVVAQTAHHVCVMYAGKVVERAATRELFKFPKHPYTVGLFRSIPRLGEKAETLDVIPGVVPSALEFPQGCRFNNRCPWADSKCVSEEPSLREVGTPEEPHQVACHYTEKVKAEDWHRMSEQKLAELGEKL